jgi:NAD(P) transhydrogenase subunit alpha
VSIHLAIPKETNSNEKRVAASPDTVKKYAANGVTVTVQSGAGQNAAFTDSAYKDAGAKIAKTYGDTVKDANIVLKVQAPTDEEIKDIPKGALLVAMLAPFANKDILKDCAAAGIDSFSMEFVPRISRAQSMDVLSSQSNLAGYKAVLDAAEHYPHAIPMMMTAAGTVAPAKVFVMGAGVAGLQAIATARRLGGVVSATDVRPAAKEQVESLGASFIAVEDKEFKQAETAGGYAKEMSAEYKKKQAALVEKHIAKQDIVITTALIPGRPAPKLISEDMVKSMKAGSVIVDLAVENGGNCELSEAGKVVSKHNVTMVGHLNVPSRLAADASALYAKNLLNLINLIIDSESKELNINWEDEIIQGVCMTRDGKVVHPNFGGKAKAAPAEKKAEVKKEDVKPKAEDKKDDKKEDKKEEQPKAKKEASEKKEETKEKPESKETTEAKKTTEVKAEEKTEAKSTKK